MRRLLVVAGVLILAVGIAVAYYESTNRYGGSVRGTSTEFDPTRTVAAPQPSETSILSPMFGGVPQHLTSVSGSSGRRFGKTGSPAARR